MALFNEDMKFTVYDKEGNPVECEVLFTFDNTVTGVSYVVYTDHFVNEDGTTRVLANIYDPEDDTAPLQPIKDDETWEIIEKMLNGMNQLPEFPWDEDL